MITKEKLDRIRRDWWELSFTSLFRDYACKLIPELIDEIERLQKIAEYAEHRESCSRWLVEYPKCDCGLTKAKK